MTNGSPRVEIPDCGFNIVSEALEGKTRFSIHQESTFVHQSFLYNHKRILKLLDKKGPIIGDCVTNPDFRGKSIYPFVINSIARKKLDSGVPEVFIVVNPDNASSIRGIEKAGFQLYAEIKASRFLLFYLNVNIKTNLASN